MPRGGKVFTSLDEAEKRLDHWVLNYNRGLASWQLDVFAAVYKPKDEVEREREDGRLSFG